MTFPRAIHQLVLAGAPGFKTFRFEMPKAIESDLSESIEEALSRDFDDLDDEAPLRIIQDGCLQPADKGVNAARFFDTLLMHAPFSYVQGPRKRLQEIAEEWKKRFDEGELAVIWNIGSFACQSTQSPFVAVAPIAVPAGGQEQMREIEQLARQALAKDLVHFLCEPAPAALPSWESAAGDVGAWLEEHAPGDMPALEALVRPHYHQAKLSEAANAAPSLPKVRL